MGGSPPNCELTTSRRTRFLVGLFSLWALVLASCGREGGPGPDRSAPPTIAPRSSDVVRLGYANEPPTLDPLGVGGGSAATRDILRPVLPALFTVDASLKPKPELAAAWPKASEIDFDPFTVTVRLKDASWSDGRPITSKDVRFSWTKLRDGPTGYRYRFLRDVSTPSDRTVVLEFDRPVRRWWSLFSVDDMVLPAHAYDETWSEEGPTVSGGPFAVDEWTEGLQVKLVRNERFWGDAAPLAGIDVMFVPDDESRLQLLERGDLDVVFSEGDVNIGRRAKARDLEPKRGPLDGSGGASNAFGPTWWELDLDPGQLKKPVALAIVAGTHPTLAAEIFE
ncbi:MAG: ABC transporter substrate-binding protein, partial [Actinomycetota bacterium]